MSATESALRPLLPLRPIPRFDVQQPLEILTEELVAAGVDSELARSAVADFATRGEVEVG